MTGHDAERYVRGFARGLEVLEAMGQGPARKTLAEVASLCGLPRSVAKRLLLTLVAQRFAREDGRRYWLTPKALRLGLTYLYSLPFWRQAQLVLEELRGECGESCAMAVLDDEDIVYVVRIPARRMLATNLTIGSRIPAHAVSLGRVLLAGLDDEALRRYLRDARLTAFTPRTIVAPARLATALEAVRAKGYAWIDSELDDAICGIAVPVRDEEGHVVAAINVSLTAGSFTETTARKRFLALLRRAAVKIRTSTLGGPPAI
ncbi:MAG: helix-turn-helix domain-containing protein [Burkholderiales bacterium]|nr:helix-turn-helix domain-containing protein [Burkholderiales bacterium]